MKRMIQGLSLLLWAGMSAAFAGAVPGRPVEPVSDADFYNDGNFGEEQIELGRMLFFDKILSGNRNISCSTCHHPSLATGDGLALPLGEGAAGLGPERRVSPDQPVGGRVPRNSQPLFFKGAREFRRMFHDGRIQVDEYKNWDSGFWTPARDQLPAGLDNVLAVQAMFPVTSGGEMAGQKGENPVADAVALGRLGGSDGAWEILAARLRQLPEYVEMFQAAYGHIQEPGDIRFVDAANAIAAFETVAFRADNSPFDEFLRSGDPAALPVSARRGMELFYGEAGCASCHSGKFLTDQEFHAIAMPQIGPGKNDGRDSTYWSATGYRDRLEDFGRARESNRPENMFQFRTPGLRNVELTGPYGHAGAYETLEEVIAHKIDPIGSLNSYMPNGDLLPPLDLVVEATVAGSRLQYQAVSDGRMDDFMSRDGWIMRTAGLKAAIAEANELEPVALTDEEVADLIAFLKALTDPASRNLSHLVPDRVPSGLPVDR